MQTHVDILVPLLLGLFIFAVTTVQHAFPLRATVDFIRRKKLAVASGRASGATSPS